MSYAGLVTGLGPVGWLGGGFKEVWFSSGWVGSPSGNNSLTRYLNAISSRR